MIGAAVGVEGRRTMKEKVEKVKAIKSWVGEREREGGRRIGLVEEKKDYLRTHARQQCCLRHRINRQGNYPHSHSFRFGAFEQTSFIHCISQL